MAYKLRIPGLLAVLMLFLFFFARPFLSEPTLARTEDNRNELEEQVFQDAIASFALYTDLIEDVQYRRDSIYPVVLKAATLEEAVKWLSQGFREDLARSVACCYLAWDENLDQLVLLPQDSIPVLTMHDKATTAITMRNDRQARLECLYSNCYAPGDRYRYIIEVEKIEGRWKVYELALEETVPGQF